MFQWYINNIPEDSNASISGLSASLYVRSIRQVYSEVLARGKASEA